MLDDENSLSVGVVETSWSFTECYGSMPPLAEASCRHLLNRMNTETDDKLFGPGSDPDVEVVLPMSLVSREDYIYRRIRHAVATNDILRGPTLCSEYSSDSWSRAFIVVGDLDR